MYESIKNSKQVEHEGETIIIQNFISKRIEYC